MNVEILGACWGSHFNKKCYMLKCLFRSITELQLFKFLAFTNEKQNVSSTFQRIQETE